jgi:hypothetical protein
MEAWATTYYQLPEINEEVEENINSYKSLLSNIQINYVDDSIQTKVIQIENEYEKNLKELMEECNNQELIDSYLKKNSLHLLQKELEIIKLLTKYALQNSQLDYNFFLASLKLLFQISETLRKRLGQKEIIHDNKPINSTNISRCSYKFCSFKENCTYNYNSKIKSLCYQDHYVHRMVSADLNVLILYIEQKFDDNHFVIHNKEILKTINTLSYVINHMENELKTKCMYIEEKDWETCHFIKCK